MSSYQYRKSHCGDKTILRLSYLHNGISYTGKTTSLYWIGAQGMDLMNYREPVYYDQCWYDNGWMYAVCEPPKHYTSEFARFDSIIYQGYCVLKRFLCTLWFIIFCGFLWLEIIYFAAVDCDEKLVKNFNFDFVSVWSWDDWRQMDFMTS